MDWDEGPEVGGPYAPYRQSERRDIYRDVVAEAASPAGHLYESFSNAEEIEARHVAAGRNPKLGYDNYDRDAHRRAEGRRSAPRAASRCCALRMPDEDLTWTDLVRGEVTFAAGSVPDFVVVRAQRRSAVHAGESGRRRADADHARAARRGPAAVDAAADRAVPRADRHRRRRRDPAVRPPAVRDGRGQQEAVQARPAVVAEHSTASRATCPRACSTTSRCSAGRSPTTTTSSRSQEMVEHFDVADVNANPARFDPKKCEAINADAHPAARRRTTSRRGSRRYVLAAGLPRRLRRARRGRAAGAGAHPDARARAST